ncbi:MAG: 2,3-bisphosphoglycerate-independent phosphoglycerate mutase, partial [Candidatus Diapherotrites archaeon]|nr:2,3-bisphosphoglycerate-independent phosphoglycerate mutase [Candidatus Diapherotrites archaeon]
MQKLILIVLDGWGIAPPGPGNCITAAKKPYYDSLISKYPHCRLQASGNHVGLPAHAMGTSEVGHLHMGAGRIVWQPIVRIDHEIKDGSFFKNKQLLQALQNVKKNKKTLHLMGLCSDGKVHSALPHLFALLELAHQQKVQAVFLHFFADGRDVPEKSALDYVKKIEDKMTELGTGKIASVIGRFYAMDRDTNYDRTQKAFELLTEGKGFLAPNATQAIQDAYRRNDPTDYYIQPECIQQDQKPLATINDGDTVLFFNTRTDRIRQLIKCFTQDDFPHFKRNKRPRVQFYSFVQTDASIPTDRCIPLFNPVEIDHNFATT